MKAEVIDKLGLVETNGAIGYSFINGIKMYQFGDCMVSMCDFNGNPSDKILIIKGRRWLRIDESVFLYMDADTIKKVIESEMNRLT